MIFTGDNGTTASVIVPPFVPAQGKGSPYEGGVNVPLIVSGPAVQSPGREEGALVAAVDLFATIAELAGVDVAAVIPPWVVLDSVSLVPYISNAAQTPLRATVLAERFHGRTWDAT